MRQRFEIFGMIFEEKEGICSSNSDRLQVPDILSNIPFTYELFATNEKTSLRMAGKWRGEGSRLSGVAWRDFEFQKAFSNLVRRDLCYFSATN